MKKFVFALVLLILLLTPCFEAAAQTGDSPGVFDTTGFPQWAKDLRRFDIIAFGTFPFSMMFTSFFYDMYRWNNANRMDFSAEGRRYAPWPFRSAGAIEWTNTEFRNTILLAAGLSLVFATVDLIIVRSRQNRERGIIESLPSPGTVYITRRPFEEVDDLEEEPPGAEDTVDIEEIVIDELPPE
jgi:hypothetical protein